MFVVLNFAQPFNASNCQNLQSAHRVQLRGETGKDDFRSFGYHLRLLTVPRSHLCELRFWSAEQATWFQLQSEVAIAVAKALRKAGIEIPFPQRDLHVRSVDTAVRSTFVRAGTGTSSLACTSRPKHATAAPPQSSHTEGNPRQK